MLNYQRVSLASSTTSGPYHISAHRFLLYYTKKNAGGRQCPFFSAENDQFHKNVPIFQSYDIPSIHKSPITFASSLYPHPQHPCFSHSGMGGASSKALDRLSLAQLLSAPSDIWMWLNPGPDVSNPWKFCSPGESSFLLGVGPYFTQVNPVRVLKL